MFCSVKKGTNIIIERERIHYVHAFAYIFDIDTKCALTNAYIHADTHKYSSKSYIPSIAHAAYIQSQLIKSTSIYLFI